MTKAIALIALLQTGLVFSPIVRADDMKAPSALPAKEAADADAAKTDAKGDEDCGCKGHHGKKSSPRRR